MRTIFTLLVLLFCFQTTLADAQVWLPFVPPQSERADTLAASLQAELDAITPESGEVAEDLWPLRDLYTEALAEANAAQRSFEAARKFRQDIENAPAELASARSELEKPAEDSIPSTDGMTLSEIEASLAKAETELQQSRQLTTRLSEESTRRDQRRSMIPDQLSAARQRLVELTSQAVAVPSADVPPALTRARSLLREALILSTRAQIQMLEAESASYDARADLLRARKSLAARLTENAASRVELWERAANKRRRIEVAEAADEAEQLESELTRLPQALRDYAETNSEIASDLESLPQKIQTASSRASTNDAKISSLRQRFSDIQRRLNVSGLNKETGYYLRNAYAELPDAYTLRKDIKAVEDELEEVRYEDLEYESELEDVDDIDSAVRRLFWKGSRIPEDASPQLLEAQRKLVAARKDLLEKQISFHGTLITNMEFLVTSLRELEMISSQYRDFVEERIFWVRSIDNERLLEIEDLRETAAWVSGPAEWIKSLRLTIRFAGDRWFIVIPIALALILLYWLVSKGRRKLKELSGRVSSYRTDRFTHTLEALFISVLVAAPTALLLYMLGRLLAAPDGQFPPVLRIGQGLQFAALTYFSLAFFRVVARPKGLGEAHFRWPASALATIRRNLRWFIPLIVTLEVIASGLTDAADIEYVTASIGRLAFTVGLIAMAVFLHRLLKPRGPVLKRFLEENEGGILYRLRYLWYPLAVLLPLLFIILSWAGFHYTALQLETKLEQSLALAMVLVVLNAVLHRWLFIARRKVAIEDAKRRREQALAEEKAKQTADDDHQPEAPPVDEEKVDLPALSLQTKQLFKAASVVAIVLGLYLIWAQALPALRMLDRVQIWPSVRVLEAENTVDIPLLSAFDDDPQPAPVQSTDETGEDAVSGDDLLTGLTGQLNSSAPSGDAQTTPSASADDDTYSLTVADLGMAIVVLIATIVAFRNVPGLIEIMVLQRLPLDTGSRYALSTVLRYIIAIVGIAIAFTTIGITWDKVQWLAAALTFGLAFGLQEIFANFISGLIILAERPVRLGDTVTVSGTTGTVTRIRMRATTITDWDRKEMIIPNKTFITTDVINWSLSDPSLRMIINVGVSYSSDIDLVESLLREVASENKVVLTDPKPQVIFTNFGDSTLDYELRVFIPSIEHLVPQRHALRTAIIKKFRQHDVEIAFPQRDLHVRSIGDLAKLAPRGNTQDEPSTHDGRDAPDQN